MNESEIKFTPGPWRPHIGIMEPDYIYTGKDESEREEDASCEETIACYIKREGDTLNHANAYLIAAAPEMYEIVAKLEEMALSGCASVEDVQNLIQRAMFVAKKARGEK